MDSESFLLQATSKRAKSPWKALEHQSESKSRSMKAVREAWTSHNVPLLPLPPALDVRSPSPSPSPDVPSFQPSQPALSCLILSSSARPHSSTDCLLGPLVTSQHSQTYLNPPRLLDLAIAFLNPHSSRALALSHYSIVCPRSYSYSLLENFTDSFPLSPVRNSSFPLPLTLLIKELPAAVL